MFSNKQHNYPSKAALNNHITLSGKRTIIYGIRSVTYQSGYAGNNILKENEERDYSNNSKYLCKKSISKYIYVKSLFQNIFM